MLSYPSDEVGNHLLDLDLLDEKGIDPYKDVLTQAEFEALFGKSKHTFTDMDYVNYYKELIEEEGAEAEIIFANNPRKIVDYTDKVICADHSHQSAHQASDSRGRRQSSAWNG